jgi:hypothetical protein
MRYLASGARLPLPKNALPLSKEAILYGQDHREHIPPTGSVNVVAYANTPELGELTAVFVAVRKRRRSSHA